MLNRLAGLETEYAIRYRPASGDAPRLTRFQLYQRIAVAVRQTVLTVRAQHFKEGIFTANGGAIWFESERPASGAGLIEGATPECRGARQLVGYQRAQDRLVEKAALAAGVPGEFQLIKNDRDAQGHVFGAQENYHVPIARGWRLAAWRAGLAALFPLVALSWLGFYLLIGMLLLYLSLAGLFFLAFHWVTGNRRQLALTLFGRDLVEGRETGAPTPAWMESVVLNATRVLSGPLALALLVHCRLFAFYEIRRGLTAFLASRCVLSGSGYVDAAGNYQLADKAPAMNCLVGLGGFVHDRPVYTMGHFFKALCVESMFSLRNYLTLFARRQRLQIGLGDSNMCEVAEWLKVGTTLLILDAIEAGELAGAPQLRRPIRALRGLAADATLRAEVELRDRRPISALELQQAYFAACRRFVAQNSPVVPEALELLQRWEETLEALREHREQATGGAAPQRLVGVLDWATKLYLLNQVPADAPWVQRKKVDIRYHELSPDGYYRQLEAAGITTRIVSDADLDRATRLPPPNSPATTRGHFIREFGDSDAMLGVNWRTVMIGKGRRAKVVVLDRCQEEPLRGDARAKRARPTSHKQR